MMVNPIFPDGIPYRLSVHTPVTLNSIRNGRCIRILENSTDFALHPEKCRLHSGDWSRTSTGSDRRSDRNLWAENATNGLVEVIPPVEHPDSQGIKTFAELESSLLENSRSGTPILHYVGHGVLYNDEPCLCLENGNGAIDYVTVSRLRQLFIRLREKQGADALPAIIFINACSSSSRGRYSSGFAAGLHDLGICVIGYSSQIQDDYLTVSAAKNFYQSLCINQALQKPKDPPTVHHALEATRRELRNQEQEGRQLGNYLRAYFPVEVSYYLQGRTWLERHVQNQYNHWAKWMNPMDYTDHLSLGFVFAFLRAAAGFTESVSYIP